MRWTELAVFTLLFAFVTRLGFYATRWKKAPHSITSMSGDSAAARRWPSARG
ncbi:MAG: hypothetical protein ACRDRP_12310 [Pseudonocardiaceae bacterium]